MAPATSRTTECTPAIRAGRMAKAKQFIEAAETVEALADDSTISPMRT